MRGDELEENPVRFLDLRYRYDEAKFVIIPARIGGHSSWAEGSERAPDVILKTSYHLEDFDTYLGAFPERAGIFTARGTDNLDYLAEVVKRVADDGKFPVVLGGEHIVTHKAISLLSVDVLVVFDAHADLMSSYHGDKLSHACATFLCSPLVKDIYVIGVRNIAPVELDFARERGVKLVFAEEVLAGDLRFEAIEGKVWLSFDFDFLDPSVMPSVSTPEPPGPDFMLATRVLDRVVSLCDVIVGMDFVEFVPDGTRYAEITAGKMIYRAIGLVARKMGLV